MGTPSVNRNRIGAVAFRTGELKRDNWRKMRRTKEKAFYDAVYADSSAAKTIVDAMQGASYDYPASGTAGLADIGLTALAGQPGPAKALATALTARDRGAPVAAAGGNPAIPAGSGHRLA